MKYNRHIALFALLNFALLSVTGQSQNYLPIPDSVIYASPHKLSDYNGVEIIPVWPAGYSDIDFKHKKSEYCDNQTEFPNDYGQDRWVKHVSEPAIYLFRPAQNKNSKKAVIIYPGGGARWISIDREGFNVAARFNQMGYTAFVVKYRTYPERFWEMKKPNKEFEKIFMATLTDNQRALKTVQHYAQKFDICPDSIGVIGFSAGAWVCSHLTFASLVNNNRINDSIDIINQRPAFTGLIYGVGAPTINFIENTKNPTIPPVYIVASNDDPYIKKEECIKAMNLLRAKGVVCDTLFFNSGKHGWGVNSTDMETNVWPEKFDDWLRNLNR